MSSFTDIISFILFPASKCLAALKYVKNDCAWPLCFSSLSNLLSSHYSWLTQFPAAFFVAVILCLRVFHFVTVPLNGIPRLEVSLHGCHEQPKLGSLPRGETWWSFNAVHTPALIHQLHLHTSRPLCPAPRDLFSL